MQTECVNAFVQYMCDSMDACGALENVRGINSTIQHEPAVLKSFAHFMPGLINFKRKTFLSFVTCCVVCRHAAFQRVRLQPQFKEIVNYRWGLEGEAM